MTAEVYMNRNKYKKGQPAFDLFFRVVLRNFQDLRQLNLKTKESELRDDCKMSSNLFFLLVIIPLKHVKTQMDCHFL